MATPSETRPGRAVRSYNIYAGSTGIMQIEGRPGTLHSVAAPPPDGTEPPRHPFLHGVSHDMRNEHRLRELLLASATFDGFLARLVGDGFDLMGGRERPGDIREAAQRIRRGDELVAVAWPCGGQFSTLWWQPDGDDEVFPHALLTVYQRAHEAPLHEALRSTTTHEALLAVLTRAGYTIR